MNTTLHVVSLAGIFLFGTLFDIVIFSSCKLVHSALGTAIDYPTYGDILFEGNPFFRLVPVPLSNSRLLYPFVRLVNMVRG